MFSKLAAKLGCVIGGMIGLLMLIAVCAVSWIFVCGLVWLIGLYFAFEFSWGLATGIWLILILLGGVFGSAKN